LAVFPLKEPMKGDQVILFYRSALDRPVKNYRDRLFLKSRSFCKKKQPTTLPIELSRASLPNKNASRFPVKAWLSIATGRQSAILIIHAFGNNHQHI